MNIIAAYLVFVLAGLLASIAGIVFYPAESGMLIAAGWLFGFLRI